MVNSAELREALNSFKTLADELKNKDILGTIELYLNVLKKYGTFTIQKNHIYYLIENEQIYFVIQDKWIISELNQGFFNFLVTVAQTMELAIENKLDKLIKYGN